MANNNPPSQHPESSPVKNNTGEWSKLTSYTDSRFHRKGESGRGTTTRDSLPTNLAKRATIGENARMHTVRTKKKNSL